MLVANQTKIDELRTLVDEEVTRQSLEQECSRYEAYVFIASSLGFDVRAYSGNEGWACVIGFAQAAGMDKAVQELRDQHDSEMQPFYEAVDQLGKEIDKELQELNQALESESIEPTAAHQKISAIRSQMSHRDTLWHDVVRREKALERRIASKLRDELQKAIVVFGVSIEVAIIAMILRALDPQCDAFLSQRELLALYTPQDLKRRSGCVQRQHALAPTKMIPFFDDTPNGQRSILARGIAMLIADFLRKVNN